MRFPKRARARSSQQSQGRPPTAPANTKNTCDAFGAHHHAFTSTASPYYTAFCKNAFAYCPLLNRRWPTSRVRRGGGVLSGGGTRRLCVALFAGVGLKYESPIVLRGGVQAQARPPMYEVSTGPRLEVRRPEFWAPGKLQVDAALAHTGHDPHARRPRAVALQRRFPHVYERSACGAIKVRH